MASTVVHVVGEADTGSVDPRRPAGERRDRVARWLRALDAALATGPQAVRDHLLTPWEPDPGDRFVSTPLPAVLAASGPTEAVDLLLVTTSTTTAGVPSAIIGDGLRRAVACDPGALGTPVARLRTCAVAEFSDDGVAPAVATALADEPDEPVVLSFGSGASGLLFAALAGVIESGRRWSLRSSLPPYGPVSLRPATLGNQLVPWLLRLGHPRRVLAMAARGALDPPPEPEVLDYARHVADRLDAVSRGAAGVADLAEWVRTDLRRLDGTAGIAVRAWIEAEYRRRLRADGAALPDLLDAARRGAPVQLGRALAVLHQRRRQPGRLRASFESASGRWLLSDDVHGVHRAAAESAHDFTPLPASVVAAVGAMLPHDDAAHLPAALPAFGLPSGTVAVVWTAGRPDPVRETYATTLLRRPISADVLRHAGYPDRRTLGAKCLVIGTAGGTLPAAAQQVEQLHAEVTTSYDPITAQVVAIADRESATAEQAVAAALTSSAADVDAVIVVPTGPKAVVLGALLAALGHAQARAVPVLLECTDRGSDRPTYHRFVAHLGADDVLLELALESVRRLEFDTAARLLGIGSPPLRALVPDVDRLAADLRSSDPRSLAGRLELCEQLLRDGTVIEPTRVRITHLAAEMLGRTQSPARWSVAGKRLTQLRDQLAVNHGSSHAAASIRELLAKLGDERHPAPRSLPQLIAAVVRAADRAHPRGVDDLGGRYRSTVHTMERLRRERPGHGATARAGA